MRHKTQQSDRLSVHRKLFGVSSDTQNYLEAGEILRWCWLIKANAFKGSITVILVAKAKFSTTASSKKASLGDSNNDWQPEMAAETGSTYIFETVRETIKIPTANLEFTTIVPNGKCGVFDKAEFKSSLWTIVTTTDKRK